MDLARGSAALNTELRGFREELLMTNSPDSYVGTSYEEIL